MYQKAKEKYRKEVKIRLKQYDDSETAGGNGIQEEQ